MPLLSVIIPAYNEEDSIAHVVPALRQALDGEKIDFEVIFIDDGSSDLTYQKIREQSKSEKGVRGYSFSRNFGKEAAIWAGLQKAAGDCCVVMDCDLQHPPEVLPQMYRRWEEGYEVVEGVKASRGRESLGHRLFANAFYRLIVSLSGLDMRASSDFKLLDRRVLDELLQLNERNTFFRGLSYWVGFRATRVPYEVAQRRFGTTKWNMMGLLKYALNNIAGFSTVPLQFVTVAGSIFVLLAIVLGIQTVVRFLSGQALEGFTTTILLILFIGGGIMTGLGIIGLYIAKIYEEVKGRPRFIIRESTESQITADAENNELRR